MILREAQDADFPRIVELNTQAVEFTSAMDIARLRELDSMSVYHKVAELNDSVAAFLLVLGEGVPYDSENYQWFAERYPRFLYVDRIVVDPGYAGHGIGRALYEDLFQQASKRDVPVITCEYNIEPPNVASRHFHDSFGFEEVGRQAVGGGKGVSMQVRTL